MPGPGGGKLLRKSLPLAAILIFLTAISGTAQPSGHIYLLRGLAGIFSTGLDTLADKLHARGYTATLHSYDDYEALAAEAAREKGKGPIVIIGHSLGANAAIFMAEKMKSLGVPVALVVTFAPTEALAAPSNVAQLINYDTDGDPVMKGPGFKGSISNVEIKDFGINHFNVEKIDRLHTQVIARIQAIMGRRHIGHAGKLRQSSQ